MGPLRSKLQTLEPFDVDLLLLYTEVELELFALVLHSQVTPDFPRNI